MVCLLKRLQCHRGELRTVIGPSSLLIIKASAICVRSAGRQETGAGDESLELGYLPLADRLTAHGMWQDPLSGT